MECGGLKGGGVRAALPTEQGWKLCVLRQCRAYRQNGRIEPSAPYESATRFAVQVRADGLDFLGSKFSGGQVAEFDLDAFIGGGFGGFLQELFSIFV